MDRWRGKVAVVTGASAGIGLAIAKALVYEGMVVVGLARRKDKMQAEMNSVKGPGKFYAVQCDVSNEKQVTEAFDYIKKTFKTLNVLINNAGILTMKSIEDAELHELKRVIDVNLVGLVHCSKLAVQLMKENNSEAYIMNISSVAGHKVPNIVLPGVGSVKNNVYSPTKFAVTALSEVLVNELRGHKIRVSNVSPGYVLTEIVQTEDLKAAGFTEQLPSLKSEDVADAVVYLLRTPTHVQITELTIKPLGEMF